MQNAHRDESEIYDYQRFNLISNNKYINGSWEVHLTWLDCNHLQSEDVRLACAQTPELFFDLPVPFQLSAKEQKIIYANLYRNTINDGDSQTSPLPIFPEGGRTSVHRLVTCRLVMICLKFSNSSKRCHWLFTEFRIFFFQ